MSSNVTLRNEAGATTTATGTWKTWSKASRAQRAVLRLVGFWLAAIPGAFIPIFHFIWVPAMVIAGVGMAIAAWKTEQQLTGIQGSCPSCQEVLTLSGGRHSADMHDTCPSCNRLIRIAHHAEAS